jgi:hypothetical protein
LNAINRDVLGKDLRIEGGLFMQGYPDISLKIEMTHGVRGLTGKRVGRIGESAYASKVYLADHDVVNQSESCHWLPY